MEDKYIKFYKTFHKKFKNDENLIHCFELLSDGGVVLTHSLFLPCLEEIFIFLTNQEKFFIQRSLSSSKQ